MNAIENVIGDLLADMGTDLTTYVLLMVACIAIIAMAVNPLFGIMIGFLFTAILVIIFYSLGYALDLVIVVLLTWFVLLVLGVLLSYKRGQGGFV